MVVPWLRMSFASLSRRRPQFNSNSVDVTLVVENRQWGKLFFFFPGTALWFPSVIITRPLLHIHSFSYRRCYIMSATDSVFRYHTLNLPYILESNPHPFYSFRGLKFRCGLDSRSRAGFWKNDRAAVRVVRTIQ